jgi:Spy/CpxP family protein refolding chaperone
MEKKGIIICGIVVLALCSLPAFAHGPFSGRGTGECLYGGQGLEGSLTAEQQAELRELRQGFADQTQELRETLQAKRQEMRTLMGSSSPDGKDLKRVQAEVNTLRAQLDDARIDHVLKVKKIDPRAFAGYGRGYGYHAWKDGRRSSFREGKNRRAYCPNTL